MSVDNSVVPVLHTVRRPGRKPGVKTVAESVESVRRNWLQAFLRTRGNNARLCELLETDDAFVSHLAAGRQSRSRLFGQFLPEDKWSPAGVALSTMAVAEGPFRP